MPRKVYAKVFKFRGGHLALNFANTVQWHASDAPIELVNSYEDLLNWSRKAELINANLAGRLARIAAARPAQAQTACQQALRLREALYRIFAAQAHQQTSAPPDLQTLSIFVAGSYTRLRLRWQETGYQWAWAEDEESLDMLLWPIARSAADLLVSEQLRRVGQCASDDGCGWLFLDTSKNHRRKWCAMNDCGSLHKARQYYRRHRQAARRR